MGRKRQAACVLHWAATHPDIDVVVALTDAHIDGSPTAAVAEANGIPTMAYAEAEAAIESGDLEFDLGISLGYWRVVRPPMLKAARLGIINVHPAPLPELRGRGGYNIALLENHEQYAVTAHYMDDGVDTGPIITRRSVDIEPAQDTAASLGERAMEAAGRLCIDVIQAALECAPLLLPTSENVGGRTFRWRDMEPLKEITDGDDVDGKARAFWFPPYEGAWTEVAGERVTVTPKVVLSQLASDETVMTDETRAV